MATTFRWVSVAPLDGGRCRRPVFEKTPLDLLPIAGGRLLLAYEERLALCDLHGRELAALAFEAPLLRQAYRLLLSPDGAWGALVTPWFVQVFDSGLRGLHGRIRFEDAGHYIKYAAILREFLSQIFYVLRELDLELYGKIIRCRFIICHDCPPKLVCRIKTQPVIKVECIFRKYAEFCKYPFLKNFAK